MVKSSNKKIHKDFDNKKTVCEICRVEVHYIFVHGHYQCPNCKQVVVTCCEAGENNCKTGTDS